MNRLLPWLLLCVLGIIWGTNFLFMKVAVGVLPALEVAWMRTLFGALPIVALALVTKAIDWRDWRRAHHFLVMAVLANVGPYVFFILGTKNLPSGIAGVISGAIPCITAIVVAVALPAERITRWKAIGVLTGFVGVVLVTPIGAAATQAGAQASFVGAACVLGGAISYSLALVYAKRFIAPLGLSAVRLAAYQMLLASAVLTPFAAPGHWAILAAHPMAFLDMALGLGFLGTGVAFVIYYFLIARLGALRAASVYYIPPVVALGVGALFANEQISVRQALGTFLVMGAIYFAIRPEGPAQQASRPGEPVAPQRGTSD
jgi:drug/metabolite transporter (DMT)-like permease